MLDTSDEDLRQQLLQKLIDQKLTGPTKQIMDCDPRRLEQRELPFGNIANLFAMYLAYCRASNLLPAGKSTFYAVAQLWLSTCLKFMRKCTHAVCWTCSTLRAAIRNAGDFESHARLTDQLLGHYTEMYRDREVYWMSRERSQAQGDILTVILDSYDKAKIQLPRFPGTRVPKKAVYEAIKRHWEELQIDCFVRNSKVPFSRLHVCCAMGTLATCIFAWREWSLEQTGLGRSSLGCGWSSCFMLFSRDFDACQVDAIHRQSLGRLRGKEPEHAI